MFALLHCFIFFFSVMFAFIFFCLFFKKSLFHFSLNTFHILSYKFPTEYSILLVSFNFIFLSMINFSTSFLHPDNLYFSISYCLAILSLNWCSLLLIVLLHRSSYFIKVLKKIHDGIFAHNFTSFMEIFYFFFPAVFFAFTFCCSFSSFFSYSIFVLMPYKFIFYCSSLNKLYISGIIIYRKFYVQGDTFEVFQVSLLKELFLSYYHKSTELPSNMALFFNLLM